MERHSRFKAIQGSKKSWNKIKSTTIHKCFRNAEFLLKAPSNVDESEDPNDEIPLANSVQQLRSKNPSVQIIETDDVDDSLAT